MSNETELRAGNPWKVAIDEGGGGFRIFKVGNTLDLLWRERGIAHLREQTTTPPAKSQ